MSKTMIFVDGTNFLNELGRRGFVGRNGEVFTPKWKLKEHDPPEAAIHLLAEALLPRRPNTAVRAYWFGSYEGSDQVLHRYQKHLQDAGFHPVILKKTTKGEKGVDMALALEMLTNAVNQNFDYAFLVAGDEDYAGLVREVRRYGPRVMGAFWPQGLSPRLRLELDGRVHDFSHMMKVANNRYKHELEDACRRYADSRRGAPGTVKKRLDEALDALRIRCQSPGGLGQHKKDAVEALRDFFTQDNPRVLSSFDLSMSWEEPKGD
ncbi:NYN domain-containing protein [Planctomycetota bacterium]|nr:NYN domain-containing protein [Planctomycetota bacterium]